MHPGCAGQAPFTYCELYVCGASGHREAVAAGLNRCGAWGHFAAPALYTYQRVDFAVTCGCATAAHFPPTNWHTPVQQWIVSVVLRNTPNTAYIAIPWTIVIASPTVRVSRTRDTALFRAHMA